MIYLKNHLSCAQCDNLPYWLQGNSCGLVFLNYFLKALSLSAFANHFELPSFITKLKRQVQERAFADVHAIKIDTWTIVMLLVNDL